MVNAKRASPPPRSSTAALPLTRTRRAPVDKADEPGDAAPATDETAVDEAERDGPVAEGTLEADEVDVAADPQDESSDGVSMNVIVAAQTAAR
ncbi:MAG: hypothetical protein ACLQUT_08800 [Thermoleophilia bacterium]